MSYKKSKITGNVYKYENDVYILITQDDNNAIYQEQLQWLKDGNSIEVFDGTKEEIAQTENDKVNDFVTSFRLLRKENARQFSDEFVDNLTKVLIGKPSAEVDEVDEQLIDTAHKIIDRINSRNSDYWTARREINLMVAPTNTIALQFFNELKAHINDFVTFNYPTEEL